MLVVIPQAWPALASRIMFSQQSAVIGKVLFCFPRRTCIAVPLDGVKDTAVVGLIAAHDALKPGHPSSGARSRSLETFLPYLDAVFVFKHPQKLAVVQPIPR
ncbi:hypothetical protein CGMCC3_g17705 [Colletotrichum fructicola]|nr:uncharacterized protein CGMCC3_g17705 [Colletotrichum fructicola]KAE9566123.1 hypothetical protein CGMCC3_g17705 [Colletotrichum fructicola]